MSLDHTETTTEQPRLLPASLEDRLVNWIGRIGGAALLLAITLVWLSLLTWSVSDPSLTHATSGKAQNGLGALGAIVSDLFLQMLGFGTAIALLAPMLWGIELVASDRVPGFRTKASFYPLSVLALSGVFSAMPVSATWPLHHGLGGILGDLLHGVGFAVFSVINPERASLATGFMLLIIGISALAYSVGLDMKDLSNLVEGQRRRKAAAAETKAATEAAEKEANKDRRSRWLVGFWSRRKDDANSEAAPDENADATAESGDEHGHDPHLSGYENGSHGGHPYGEYEDQRWRGAQQHPGWGGGPYPVDAYGRPYDPYAYDPSGAPAGYPTGDHGHGGYGHPGAYGPAVSPQLPPQQRDGAAPDGHPQDTQAKGWHPQDWANRDWSQVPSEPQSAHAPQPMPVPVPVPYPVGHSPGHLGPRGGEGGLAHARPGDADRHEPELPGFGQDGRRRTDGAPGHPAPSGHPGHNPYAVHMGRTRRPAHEADAAGRDPGFDHLTDAASRDIAERFAPGAASEAAGKERPHVSTDAGGASQRKPGGGLLAGLGFRRAEPQFKRPSLNMLKRAAAGKVGSELTQTVLRGNARLLEDVLGDFGVKGEVRDIKPGPVVTLFEVEPARGTKSSRVIGLADDIARSMSANAVRVAVVPGRNAIGIELPNARREGVLLREILEAESFRSGESILPLALGKSIGGEPVVADLARMPHLLVAGTTGSGKSVGINAFVLSLLYRHAPEDCRLLMIDPKMLELSVYNGIPHLLTPVVTDPVKAVAALNWAVSEMEERYKRMAKLSVRNIDVYNNRVRNAKKRGELIHRSVQTGFDKRGQAVYEKEQLDLEPMPYIVIVVDEFADLMIVAGKEIEGAVQRLAQMARAAGIHLIMATQRPSVDIITGTIKANFPTRISFKVASKIDSRTILNDQGAEQLLGQGDMLYSTGSGQAVRVHGPFVSDEEVENIARFLREQGVPRYIEGITEPAASAGPLAAEARGGSDDDLYDRAVAVVLRDRKPSTSYVQRRLSIGYNRAADLIERMEREGLISPPNGTGRREILAAAGGADAAE